MSKGAKGGSRLVNWQVCLGFALVLSSRGVLAQEDAEKKVEGPQSPDEVTTGEVRITLNSDFAKLKVDGAEWEEHEFLDNGKTLVIHTVKRLEGHTLTLTPIYSDLAPVEVALKPGDWKLETVGKNLKMWQVRKDVVFQRKPPAKEPARKEAPPASGKAEGR